ncbi:type I secretion C-terminal target domain-containing protein, partial [Acinetobacter baumannii]
PDTTAPILTNLFSYDLSTDKIIFNAPSDSYFVEQKIDGAWVHVNIEEKFDWLNVEYRVTATDQAGNSSQPLTTIINTASGTYKPTDPTFTQIIKGSTGNDYLYGSNGDDTLISNGDSDRLYGGSGNDTLIYGGNSPNVYTGLIGEAGNDTYIVDKALLGSLSYVHILDNTNEQNTLYLKSVSADEIILKQTSADRVITFNDSTATIHFGEGQLSSIVFDDGTTWDKAQIEQHIAKTVVGTFDNDVVETATANQTYSYTLDTGADTLIFKVLDDIDNLGGNSNGEWTDFNLSENDKLDLSQLLINNNGNLQEFITVKDTQAGVVMSVDRDGSNQSTYHSQELILLTGKHYTLEDLMASNAFIH